MTDSLDLIAEGRHSVGAICRESKMSILELAEHICTARNLEALARVAQLHAIEREMMLGRLKTKALARLAGLTAEVPAANADEIRAAEVMRKACVDLLRYGGLNTEQRASGHGEPRGPRGGGPRSRGYHPDSITPATEAEVLEALERLGEQINDYDPRAQRSGTALPESPPSPKVTPPPKIQSRFNSQSGEEPRHGGQAGAYAWGSLSSNPLHHPRPPPDPIPPQMPIA